MRDRKLQEGQEGILHQLAVHPSSRLHPIDRKRLIFACWMVSGGSRREQRAILDPMSG